MPVSRSSPSQDLGISYVLHLECSYLALSGASVPSSLRPSLSSPSKSLHPAFLGPVPCLFPLKHLPWVTTHLFTGVLNACFTQEIHSLRAGLGLLWPQCWEYYLHHCRCSETICCVGGCKCFGNWPWSHSSLLAEAEFAFGLNNLTFMWPISHLLPLPCIFFY